MNWYREQWDKAATDAFDEKLKSIQGLAWLPWVGKNYDRFKVMIIAESHYVSTDDRSQVEAKKMEYLADTLSTREVVAEYPLHGYDAGWVNHAGRRNNPTFDNISRVLCGSALLDGKEKDKRFELWSRVAYMNFIQRPMWYSKTHGQERPVEEDRTIGWRATLEVMRVLEPDICIFTGLEASIEFDQYMQANAVSASALKTHQKIGGSYPRSAIVHLNGKDVLLRFTRHPNRYFAWQTWRNFVFDGHEDLQNRMANL